VKVSALAPCILVMGVAGAGKTTFGHAFAKAIAGHFIDADDLHDPKAKAQMQAGSPLNDTLRHPWLDRCRDALLESREAGKPVVMACSALKRAYRERLGLKSMQARLIWLAVSEDEASVRVAGRVGHIFPQSLVPSQFDALEPPTADEKPLQLDASLPLSVLVAQAIEWLGHASVSVRP